MYDCIATYVCTLAMHIIICSVGIYMHMYMYTCMSRYRYVF